MNDKVEKILRGKFGGELKLKSLDKLHGDASYRTYFRATLSDGRTFVIMQMPKGKASAFEEITNFKGSHDEPPFINVAKYLKDIGVPVPEVFAYDKEGRIMVLEDLGDDVMAKRVADAGSNARIEWYKKAIDLLILIQKKTKGGGPENCIALQRSFDEVLLNWEFDHFLKYCVSERSGTKLTEKEAAIFETETRAMSEKIVTIPYGFTHRDFQSRNFMIRGGKLFLIDFQDALRGPVIYDLVALLRDSYVELTDAELGELVGYYAELAGRPEKEVRADFDLVTVQRKLKDAGRFVYIDRVKGNPDFLKFIPASLGYVRAALGKIPEHRRLYDLIEKYIPEWK